uniref:Replication factor C (activator 1) 5 n=1 Tax=Salmo trutta TaxID=8032 RepID=A0A673Y4T7_SALTR
ILCFASTRTIFKKGFKLVILDEADAMTRDAQNALRRVHREHEFCLICNYLSKIIQALQSRCTRFRPVSGPGDPQAGVCYPTGEVSIDITPDGIKAIVTLSSGDMRSSLNILQSTSMAYGKVTEDNVYTCTGHPLRSDIANILGWSLNKVFTSAYNRILYSLSQPNVISQFMFSLLSSIEHWTFILFRMGLLIKLADIKYRLASGPNEKTQLSSMVAAFQAVREIWVNDATQTSGPQTVTIYYSASQTVPTPPPKKIQFFIFKELSAAFNLLLKVVIVECTRCNLKNG